jgi:hypothetical protein
MAVGPESFLLWLTISLGAWVARKHREIGSSVRARAQVGSEESQDGLYYHW